MHLFPKNPSKSNGIIFHGLSFFDWISVGLRLFNEDSLRFLENVKGNAVKINYYGKMKEYKKKKKELNLTFYFYLLLKNKTKSFCGFLFSMENQALNIVPQIYFY